MSVMAGASVHMAGASVHMAGASVHSFFVHNTWPIMIIDIKYYSQ